MATHNQEVHDALTNAGVTVTQQHGSYTGTVANHTFSLKGNLGKNRLHEIMKIVESETANLSTKVTQNDIKSQLSS
jgi:hypothetical protein